MSTTPDPVITAATQGVMPVKRQKTPEVETEFTSGIELEAQIRVLTLAELRAKRKAGQSIAQRIID
jgi:hypothetical protein